MIRHDEQSARTPVNRFHGWRWLLSAAVLLLGAASQARAQGQPAPPSFEVYGFAMMDIGHNFTQINPAWFDTLRVTRLPSSEKQFGEDNSTFSGVRQSRLGVRSSAPTAMGPLKTIFEFELFGTGVDEGQTTFRLRHAWGSRNVV